MKYNNVSKFILFSAKNIPWLISIFVLAILVRFFLNYFAGRMYPDLIMGQPVEYVGWLQRKRFELIILALLNVITPVVINTIDILYNDLAGNHERRETKQPYFRFYYDLAVLKRPIPYIVAKVLIIAEAAFIVSLTSYLRENYYNALNDSMDFLMGAPYLTITISNLLLLINCFLIFGLLLFSFLWGYSWVQWASDKVFPRFSDSKYYSSTLLFVSLIFRALNMLGLAFIINFMATFSGKFYIVVKIIHEITILLFLWVGFYIFPYLRERAVSKKNRIITQ